MAVWKLRARWVFPVFCSPIPDGVVTIDGDRVVAVAPASSDPVDVDLGNASVLPGFVNTHTHLDLSGMRGLAPPSPDFVGWLRQVIAHRRGQTSERVLADVRDGLTQSVRAGVTLLADISGDGSSWAVLRAAPLRAVVFRELLGLTEDRASLSLEAARRWLDEVQPSETCRPGLSPHAPYSVRTSLIAQAALLAREPRIPIAIHLAETLAEVELLHHRRGPFVSFLKDLGVWDPAGLAPDIRHVLGVSDQYIPKLYVHCNHLASTARVPRQSTVVYCPRTHAAFGHHPHPFRDFLARGVRVALGTDSLASNPDLDILAEARFVHHLYPDFPADALLRMLTLSGAEALGWADDTGSLTPGKSADLVVLPLPEGDLPDPHHLLFRSALPVRAVLFRGRWVHDAAGRLAPALSA